MLEYAFLQRALAAAVLIGLVTGVLLGLNPIVCATAVAILVALGIGRFGRGGPVGEDALIGVFLSTAMALGIVLLGLHQGYRQDLLGYLFGNVLTVSAGELGWLALLSVVVFTALALTFPALMFIAFDEEVARAYGYPVDRLNALLLVLLAVTIVLGVRLVGVLLIEALIVVPAATAALWTTNFRHQIPLSSALGMAAGVLGLTASYHLDVAAGGSIVLLLSSAFFISALVRRSR